MLQRSLVRTILIFAGLFAIAASAQGPKGPQGPPPPPGVTTLTLEAKSIPIDLAYIGTTAPSKTVEVHARIQGFIETREFEEGAFIEKGARLFTIDPRSFTADRDITVAQVEQAESQLRLAEQEVKRLKSVSEPGAIAASDLDQKVAQQANAAAAVKLAQAQLAKADLELSYTLIEAPFTGFIGKALKETGSLVDSGQNSLLAVMQQVDPIYVNFRVSESDYLAWRKDLESGALTLTGGAKEPYLEIVLLDGSTYDKRGTINFENVDVNVQTGTVELRGTFENPSRILKPGQYVKVHMRGQERPNTLAIPQRSVNESPQGAFVYVVDDTNKAERRSVTLGQWTGKDWIVKDGLKVGERIIVEGLTKVQPGIAVVPTPASAPSASSATSQSH